MTAYYNEIDPYAAQWLRNLIKEGLIAPGDVDERSIVDVRADDLRIYTQAHFFAGIGGWSVALHLAGWPDDRPVWTGSCPCQPFSAAGAGKAADDERHLWPAWFPLIAERRPAIVFGEQVEAAIGWGWLDAVFADLEGEGYACGAAVLPACGVGAPHIRQRAWFVADARHREGASSKPGTGGETRGGRKENDHSVKRSSEFGGLADTERRPAERWRHNLAGTPQDIEGEAWERERFRNDARPSELIGDVGNADKPGSQGRGERRDGADQRVAGPASLAFWSDAEWIPCTDGKARPVKPGTFPLASGIPNRVGRLRAYGNAIVPQVAAEFVKSFTDITTTVGSQK